MDFQITFHAEDKPIRYELRAKIITDSGQIIEAKAQIIEPLSLFDLPRALEIVTQDLEDEIHAAVRREYAGKRRFREYRLKWLKALSEAETST